MSSAHDAHGASAHAHDDHEAFDGEPAHELSPGEPRSPAWLPALGLAFFSCVAVYMLAGSDASAGSAPPKPLTPPEPAVTAAVPAPMPPQPRAAAPSGSAVRRLSPDQIEQVRKRVEDARAKGQAAPGGRPADPHAGHGH